MVKHNNNKKEYKIFRNPFLGKMVASGLNSAHNKINTEIT